MLQERPALQAVRASASYGAMQRSFARTVRHSRRAFSDGLSEAEAAVKRRSAEPLEAGSKRPSLTPEPNLAAGFEAGAGASIRAARRLGLQQALAAERAARLQAAKEEMAKAPYSQSWISEQQRRPLFSKNIFGESGEPRSMGWYFLAALGMSSVGAAATMYMFESRARPGDQHRGADPARSVVDVD